MEPESENLDLARKFSDKARKVSIEHPGHFLVPHKTLPDGRLVSPENCDVSRDISRLSFNDLNFLVLWRENKWDEEKTIKAGGFAPDQAERTFKKLAYFKTEDARIRAIAQEACPERIIAKDMENVETGALSDSQHKSLDRLAKITGAFKPTSEINIQQNIFNMPKVSPEAMEAIRQIAEREAKVVEAEIA